MPLQLCTPEVYVADEHAALEARARRVARRVRLYAKKSRQRRGSVDNFAGFMLPAYQHRRGRRTVRSYSRAGNRDLYRNH